MVRPVSDEFPVSQEFGSDATLGVSANSNPNSGTGYLVYLYGNYQPFGHAGQDIACPAGTPVHAIADGTVIWADWGTNLPGDDTDAGYRQRWYMYKNFPGIVTLIQHDGWISMYGHLSSNDAAPVGTRVSEGQVIGLSGNTKAPGVTLGAHLHVGALVDMSYSCKNGLIYGCTDPRPFYGTGALSVQSVSVTPAPAAEPDVTPPPVDLGDEMLTLATDGSSPQVWIGNGILRRPIWTLDTMSAAQWLASNKVIGPIYKDGEVQTIPDLNSIGIDVMALSGKDVNGK